MAEQEVVRKAELLIGMTPYSVSLIRRSYPNTPEAKIKLVRFGPDTSVFRPGKGLGIQTDPYMLIVGRITDPRKNLVNALKAFAKVSSVHRKIKLVIAGPDTTSVASLAAALGIKDRVLALRSPTVPELVKSYQSATCLI